MPYLSLTLSNELFESTRDRLLHKVSALVAETLGKSESLVCVSIQHAAILLAGGSVETPTAKDVDNWRVRAIQRSGPLALHIQPQEPGTNRQAIRRGEQYRRHNCPSRSPPWLP